MTSGRPTPPVIRTLDFDNSLSLVAPARRDVAGRCGVESVPNQRHAEGVLRRSLQPGIPATRPDAVNPARAPTRDQRSHHRCLEVAAARRQVNRRQEGADKRKATTTASPKQDCDICLPGRSWCGATRPSWLLRIDAVELAAHHGAEFSIAQSVQRLLDLRTRSAAKPDEYPAPYRPGEGPRHNRSQQGKLG
jgi:hypothetical protein